VDSKDRIDRTPLSWAAEGGHESAVKLLLKEGSDADLKDEKSRTPLSWAAKCNALIRNVEIHGELRHWLFRRAVLNSLET
jgi:ankyrin repeat protein